METSTAELQEIAGMVTAIMEEYSTEEDVRRVSEPGEQFSLKLWQALADAGMTGLMIDTTYGGAGLGPVELEVVSEAMGAALCCSPFLSCAVLAAVLVQASTDEEAKSRLLPPLADGDLIATVALTGPTGSWTPQGVAVHATSAGHLTGAAHYVTDAQSAAAIMVVAQAPDGLGVYEISPGTPGLTIAPQQTFDGTQRLATLTFDAAPAQQIATDGTWAPVQAALDAATVALAGDEVGGAQAIFQRTIEYAKTRVQFGRAIGSFQAIKHLAADLYLELESSISAARHAAQCLAAQAPRTREALALAGFTCAEAYSLIAAQAIFMHGGIGFTWEYPAHLYLRRARADAQLLGSPALYRDRYLTELGG